MDETSGQFPGSLESSKNSKDSRLETFEVDNLKNILKIWKDFRGDLWNVISILNENEKTRKLANNLVKLVNETVNKYTDIFENQQEGKFKKKEDADNFLGYFEKFLIGLKNIITKEVLSNGELNEKFTDEERALIKNFVEAVFKLNDEFCNLYGELEKSEFWEKFPIRLRDALLRGSKDYYVHEETQENIEETEEEKEIGKKYKQKTDQLKHLWISVYYPLIQLMSEELEALLNNQDEEAFRVGLKRSYIGGHIEGIEQGKKFPRSYSILKDKLENLLSKLSKLNECFDEVGNLKDDAKIPYLDNIRIKITKDDKRAYNRDERKAKFRQILTECLDVIKEIAGP